jgi:hypothetical protein
MDKRKEILYSELSDNHITYLSGMSHLEDFILDAMETYAQSKIKYVFMASTSGWGDDSVIGLFSTKEKALSSSVQYLLKKSKTLSESDILTPINEDSDSLGNSSYDITNSDDILFIRLIEIDK